MSLKEHLQFLAMMVPTLFILSAVALTFALPSNSAVPPQAASAEAVQGTPHTTPEQVEPL